MHEHKIFLLQISSKGEVLVDDTVVDRVQPFPLRYGSGTVRDGKVVFNNIRQRPTVKRSITNQVQPRAAACGENLSPSDAAANCARQEKAPS
jgi:hypothetical protein